MSRASGQVSLFGEAMATEDFIPKGEGVSEFEESILLRQEREMLGCYLSGHPLSRFDRVLSRAGISTIENLQRMKANDKVELAGVVGDISKRITKTGKEMWNIRIEDKTGSIEAVLFSSTIEESRNFLQKDTPLIFKGRVEKDDSKPMPRLRVESVKELTDEAVEEKLEKSLHLQIQTLTSVDGEQVLKQIQTILKCHKGNLNVYFHLPSQQTPGAQTVIRAHNSYSVAMNRAMIDQLKQLACVRSVYVSIGNQVRPV
jgi:DNA polymerase-3 subunit alpha